MLPRYNVFDVVPISKFWSFVESMLSIGMPFFIIGAAIAVVGWVLPLLRLPFQAAFQKGKSEDWDDSDDWDDDDDDD